MPRFRSILTALALGSAALVAALLVLVWGVLFFINTAPGTALLLGVLNNTLPGSLHSEGWTIAPLRGRISSRALTLYSPSGDTLASLRGVELRVSMRSLLQRHLDVQTLELRRVRIYAALDSAGKFNLLDALDASPAPPDTTATTGGPLPAITLRRVKIEIDTVDYSDARQELHAALGPTVIELRGTTADTSAHLRTAATGVTFAAPGFILPPSSLDVQLRSAGQTLDTLSLTLWGAGIELEVQGRADNLGSTPVVALNGEVVLAPAMLETLSDSTVSALAPTRLSFALQGDINDPDAHLRVAYEGGTIAHTTVAHARVRVLLSNRVITINELAASLGEKGQVRLQGTCSLQGVFPAGFLAGITDFSTLGTRFTLQAEALDPALWIPGIHGPVDATVRAQTRGIDPGTLEGTMTLSLDAPALHIDGFDHPIKAVVASAASAARGVLRLDSLTVDSKLFELYGRGWVAYPSADTELSLELQIPALVPVARLLDLPQLRGDAVHASLDVGAALHSPRLALRLEGGGLGWDTYTLGDLRLEAQLDTSGIVTLAALELRSENSHLSAAGAARVLEAGTLTPRDSMVLLPTAINAAVALHEIDSSLSGRCSLAVRLSGSPLFPAGDLSLYLDQVEVAGYGIDALSIELHSDGVVAVLDSLLILPGGANRLAGTGTYAPDGSYTLRLVTDGIDLGTVPGPHREAGIAGTLQLAVESQGSIAEPALTGELRIAAPSFNGNLFDDIVLSVHLAHGQARVTGQALFDLDASYQFASGDYLFRGRFDATPLEPWLVLAGMHDFGANLTGTIEAAGNTAAPLDGSVTVALDTLALHFEGGPLLTGHRLEASLHERTLSLDAAAFSVLESGSLELAGTYALDGSLDVRATGAIPLAAASPFVPEIEALTGTLTIDARLGGTAQEPVYHGSLRIADGGLMVPAMGQRLHQIYAGIRFSGSELVLDSLAGNFDEGQFRATAALQLDGFSPVSIAAEVTTPSLPLRIPGMLDARLAARLRWSGPFDASTVTGTVTLLEGVYYQDVSFNLVQGLGRRRRPAVAHPPEETDGFASSIALDLTLNDRNALEVDNNIARLAITTGLRIGGTAALPIIAGQATVREGTIIYQKKEFVITRGVIDFLDPHRTRAHVDITGRVQVRSWEIELTIEGTPEELVLNLHSTPPEEHQDILALLLFNRTTHELTTRGGEQRTPQSTEQLLAQVIESTLGDDLRRATGLDVLTVETGAQDDEHHDRIRVTLGKKLSRRLTTTWSVESAGGEVVQQAGVEVKLFENIAITGFRDTRDTYGGQVRFRLDIP